MRGFIGVVLILTFAAQGLADISHDYREAQQYIHTSNIHQQLQQSIHQGNVPIPVNSHPAESDYYHHPESLKNDANKVVNSSHSTGELITQAPLNRPVYSINEDSPEIKQAKDIQNHAGAIADGTYKDCGKKDITEVTHTKKSCTTSYPYQFTCMKKLMVNVKDIAVTKQAILHLSQSYAGYYGSTSFVNTRIKSGQITAIHLLIQSRNAMQMDSYHLTLNHADLGWYHATSRGQPFVLHLDVNGLLVSFKQGPISVVINNFRMGSSFTGVISVRYLSHEKHVTEHWDSTCT